MSESTNRCEECGAICDINDTYCKKCMHSFSKTPQEIEENVDYTEPAIEGVSTEDFKNFVDYHWKYYDKTFKKSKDKKWFFKPNFAALLFGPNWAFYRTMYAYGLIMWIVPMLVSLILTITVPAVCSRQVQEFNDARVAYSEYLNNGGESLDTYYVDGVMHFKSNPEYDRLDSELVRTQKNLRIAQFIMQFPVFVIHILMRLPANCIYKQHIKDNAVGGRRGTSKKAIFLSILLFEVLGILLSLVILWFPRVTAFFEATEQMFPFK